MSRLWFTAFFLALREQEGNMERAAARAGRHPNTIAYHMRRHRHFRERVLDVLRQVEQDLAERATNRRVG